MTERLLEGVLAGEWPVTSALRWLDGDASASPPADLVTTDPTTAWQPDPPNADTIRAAVLNFVRDQADIVLSAAEKKAAGSRSGTPNPHTLTSAPSTASGRLPKALDPDHLRRLESVARRLEPGAVDDSNFPSLGEIGGAKAGSSQEVGKQSTWAPAGAPSLAARLGGKPPAGPPMARAASSRRIQPTQVAEVEVSTQFVTAKMAEPAPAFSNKIPDIVPSKLASRLGDTKLDDDVLSIASPFASKAAAAAVPPAAPIVRRAVPIPVPGPFTASKEAPATPPKAAATPSPPAVSFPVGSAVGCATPQQARLLAAPGSGALPTPPNHASSGPGAHQSGPKGTPLCPRGTALAALYSGILSSPWSRVALAEEVTLLLNLLAVPLAAEVDNSLTGCGRLDVLLSCGAQAQQFAALVLRGAGSLLRGLGAGLLEDVAAASGEAAAALRQAGVGGDISLPASPALPPPSPLFPDDDEEQDNTPKAAEESKKEAELPLSLTEEPVPPPSTPAEALRLLRDAAAAAEAALRARQLRTEKAFNRPVSASSHGSGTSGAAGVLGGFGLHAFTADRAKARTADEQRRQSNREAVRDAWFSLMRGAADRVATFGSGEGGRATRAGPALSLSLASGADGRGGAEEPDGVVFGRLQAAAAALLRTLRPDNFGAFAELITAAVLQAAATGEALLAEDEELTRLAKRDGASRLHSLNRRMQGPDGGTGSAGAGPRRGPASGGLQRLGSGSASTTIGFSGSFSQLNQATQQPQIQQQPRHQRKGSNSANSSPNKGGGRSRPGSAASNKRGGGGGGGPVAQLFGGGGGGGGAGGSHPPGQMPAGAQAAMDEAAAAAAAVMSEFPRALRPYILFLEAADSHRLNAALTRAMAAKLRALAAPEGGSAAAAAQGLGEKVVASSALAGMLGYLAFAKGGAGARPARWDSGCGEASDVFDGSHPIDVAGAVRAALNSASLLRTLPWAGRYLSFLRFDSEATDAPYFQSLLRVLCDLRDAPELAPTSPAFGPAAFCLRAVLDGLAASGLPLPPPTPPTLPSADHAHSEATLFALDLQSADQSIDLRYIDLCCPLLAAGRRLFSSDAAARSRATTRRIQASAPRATAAAAAPPPPTGAGATGSTALPPAVAAAAQAMEDPVKLRLQQTFLAQYSDDGSLVKLKDVVEYASDVIGCNAAAAAVGSAAPTAVDAAGAELVTAAEAHAQKLAGRVEEGLTPAEALYKAQIELDRFINAAAERAAASTIEKVVSAAFEAAQTPIKVAAARAVLGLTSPDLGEAVAATAAAIVAETAAAAAAGRLAGLAQRAVRQEALAQRARTAGRAILKEAALAAAAAAEQATAS